MMKTALILAASLSLFACGNPFKSKKSDGTAGVKPTGFLITAGIAGSTYVGQCEADSDGEPFSNQASMTFFNDTAERRFLTFEGRDCSPDLRLSTYVFQATDLQQEVRSELPGWTKVLFNAGTYTTTLHTAAMAKRFSKRNNFGYSDWQVDQPKEINGRKFNDDARVEWEKGEGLENHILIEGSTLRIAKYENNAPTDKDPAIYEKQ